MKYILIILMSMQTLLGAKGQVSDFMRGWTFWSDTHQERKVVSLPHDAMQTEARSADFVAGYSMGYYPGNKYHYEKQIHVSDDMLRKHIVLHFDGVYRRSKVFINDRLAGGAQYGYIAFSVCADGLLHQGDNTIRVDVDNSLVPNSRWYSGAGIYRPVRLTIQEPVYIDDVKIRTTSLAPAQIEVITHHKGGEVTIEVYDGDRKVAMTTGDHALVTIPNAKLWTADHPYLYQVKVILRDHSQIVETQKHDFGIRQLSWSTKGFFVNGESVLLRGGCLHHDNGILGACEYDEAAERRIRILKEYGFNAIRSAHNPCSEAVLKACDKLGMYVMDELYDMWYEKKTEYDYSLDFRNNYPADIQSFIDKDYNHPSVVMYSIVNEPMEPGHPEGVEMAKEIVSQIHLLDDSRPVTAGVNMVMVHMARINIPHEDNNKNTEEKRMTSDEFNAAMQSNSERMLNAVLMPAIDSGTVDLFNTLDIAGYNYAQRRYEADGSDHPDRITVGTETYTYTLSENWEKVQRLPYLIGDFMWTAWDYIGEVGLGAWFRADDISASRMPYPWLLADTGALDLIGHPTGEALRAKAVWLNDDHPYIGVRPIQPGKLAKGRWRATNSIPSWSWRGCDGMPTQVEVFTNAEKVRLYLNDQLLGEQPVSRHLATFDVTYQPGVIRAVSIGRDGQEHTAELHSAADGLLIKVTPDRQDYHAGDLVYLDIDITDCNGIVESKADRQLTVKVNGGELLGFGSAQPCTAERFTDGCYTTRYGRSQAVIRAASPGRMTVTVTGGQLGATTQKIDIH